MNQVSNYKGSAPRAADVARYTRTRKIQPKVKGQKEEDHDLLLSTRSDSIMPRATCADLIAWCSAVRWLKMSRSDRQYGRNLRPDI